MDLTKKKCVPCEGGVPTLRKEEAENLLKQTPGWVLEENKIKKVFKFKSFVEAIKFVNKVAELAEKEGHHPDITINYSRVTVVLWTHAIGGLSQNDFILAAKVEKI